MPLPEFLKTKWFWYAMLCVFCWGGWTVLGKLATNDIPASTMQFLFPFGCVPIVLIFLISRRFRLETTIKGVSYGILMGVLAGIGGWALFAAYRTGGSTPVITVATSAYPMVTVMLAVLLLRERLLWKQWLGLIFAGAAFVIFSL